MGSEGERSSGNRRESPPTLFARARGRACLVLSLIVLVWNIAIQARDVVHPQGGPATALRSEGAPCRAGGRGPGGGVAGVSEAGAAGGRAGPLSVRQRFLLGSKVDVNRAGWEEISGLPGISDPVAREVVVRRERTGPFRRPEDLLRVRGIKVKRLENLLPFLSGFHNN